MRRRRARPSGMSSMNARRESGKPRAWEERVSRNTESAGSGYLSSKPANSGFPAVEVRNAYTASAITDRRVSSDALPYQAVKSDVKDERE